MNVPDPDKYKCFGFEFGPVKVPNDRVWVMGDNRFNSRDSHVFGPIKMSSVLGRAINKVWPVGDASFL